VRIFRVAVQKLGELRHLLDQRRDLRSLLGQRRVACGQLCVARGKASLKMRDSRTPRIIRLVAGRHIELRSSSDPRVDPYATNKDRGVNGYAQPAANPNDQQQRRISCNVSALCVYQRTHVEATR